MSTELRQIAPEIQLGDLKPYKTPEEHWQEVTEEMYGSSELPQTICHEHDPEWDQRLWSIQNAHDQIAPIAWLMPLSNFDKKVRKAKFGFWTVIGILFAMGGLSLGTFRLVR